MGARRSALATFVARCLVLGAALALPLACVGTTGSQLVTFRASASGPEDATGPGLAFTSGRGFRVTLTRATLHVGAVYLNRSVPISGGQEQSCILPGTYAAEVRAGLDVDALSPLPQPFGMDGNGTADRALTGEVWLTGGDVNAESDATVIAAVAGTFEKEGAALPFEARLTIGQNRKLASNDPATPGSNPLCKQRIVSPIPVDLVPAAGGELRLRVDPRPWFSNVDFSALLPGASGVYAFEDSAGDQPSAALYNGLRAAEGVYAFSFVAAGD